MIKSVLAFTCAALLTAGVQAQVSGSINRNAAKVSTKIEMGKKQLAVSYTAIRFGNGDWQKIKDNEASHERFNKMAEARPIGTVSTNCSVQAAGKTIPSGEYSMFFTVHPQAGWLLNLKPKEGDAIRWRLVMTETKHKSACMRISLDPSEDDQACSMTIAFGTSYVTVPVSAEVQTKDK